MMIAQLRSWFPSIAQRREAQALYIALVGQSRKAFFYADCAVPDTLDGRFDIILLHVFLALHKLNDDASEVLRRLLLEALFDDMDRSLREMGVGDMGVGKRVKTMSKAVFGRLAAYGKSFADDRTLSEALARNIYRGEEIAPQKLALLLGYARNYALLSG